MAMQEWHSQFLESLEELASTEKQRKAWVEDPQIPFPSPVELVCQIFDDSGIDDLLEAGLVFSEATDTVLRTMSALAAELNVDVGPEALLQSDAWTELSRHAARALQMVKDDLAK